MLTIHNAYSCTWLCFDSAATLQFSVSSNSGCAAEGFNVFSSNGCCPTGRSPGASVNTEFATDAEAPVVRGSGVATGVLLVSGGPCQNIGAVASANLLLPSWDRRYTTADLASVTGLADPGRHLLR